MDNLTGHGCKGKTGNNDFPENVNYVLVERNLNDGWGHNPFYVGYEVPKSFIENNKLTVTVIFDNNGAYYYMLQINPINLGTDLTKIKIYFCPFCGHPF